MRIRALAFAALCAVLLAAMPARAAPFVFGQSDANPANALVVNGSIELAPINSGWYGFVPPPDPFSDYFFSGTFGTNYLAGNDFGADYNNFFVFDITGLGQALGGDAVTSLALRLFSYGVDAPAGATYRLFDVATPLAALLNDDFTRTDEQQVYEDLGTGTSYGARDYVNADAQQTHTIALNAAAVADLNAVLAALVIGAPTTVMNAVTDGQTHFAIGGTLTALEAQVTVPEPASLALLGVGLAGLVALRRRRAA